MMFRVVLCSGRERVALRSFDPEVEVRFADRGVALLALEVAAALPGWRLGLDESELDQVLDHDLGVDARLLSRCDSDGSQRGT